MALRRCLKSDDTVVGCGDSVEDRARLWVWTDVVLFIFAEIFVGNEMEGNIWQCSFGIVQVRCWFWTRSLTFYSFQNWEVGDHKVQPLQPLLAEPQPKYLRLFYSQNKTYLAPPYKSAVECRSQGRWKIDSESPLRFQKRQIGGVTWFEVGEGWLEF